MNLARAAELGVRLDVHNEDFLQYNTPRSSRRSRNDVHFPTSASGRHIQRLDEVGTANEAGSAEPDWRDSGCGLDLANWMAQLPVDDIPLQFIRLPVWI